MNLQSVVKNTQNSMLISYFQYNNSYNWSGDALFIIYCHFCYFDIILFSVYYVL